MSANYDEIILKHYEAEASQRGLDSSSTMLDETIRRRETELVIRFVGLVQQSLASSGKAPVTLCDVGCGNGFSLETIHRQFPSIALHGFEFTPELLELSKKRFANEKGVTVARGDTRRLEAASGQFDIVICQRVLINLLDAADQRKALAELSRVLRPGGYLLSIEAFSAPLSNLNSARSEFGLEPLPPAHNNLYLEENFFDGEKTITRLTGPALGHDLPVDFLPSNFLSSHYFVARIFHPLVLGPNGAVIRNSHFVRFFSEAIDKPIGNYAPIKAYAFRKI